MVKVKICGITHFEDARHAVACGADALGFVFADSPRKISVRRASEIIRRLDPWTAVVGIFVNESSRAIKAAARACRLTVVQLHGDESPAFLKKIAPLKIIKSFRVASPEDLETLSGFEASAFLFDAKVEGRRGGTGKTFDWRLLQKHRPETPVILSGGLTPSNVTAAVRAVRPYAVDVSSGVEASPGRKDPAKVKRFILNAKKI